MNTPKTWCKPPKQDQYLITWSANWMWMTWLVTPTHGATITTTSTPTSSASHGSSSWVSKKQTRTWIISPLNRNEYWPIVCNSSSLCLCKCGKDISLIFQNSQQYFVSNFFENSFIAIKVYNIQARLNKWKYSVPTIVILCCLVHYNTSMYYSWAHQ